MPADRGECGARGRGFITSAPGRLWASACRDYDRRARCIAGLGQVFPGRVTPAQTVQGLRSPVGAGVKDRALRPSPRKPGLKLSLGDEYSLRREPWWNADRRARPQAEGRRKPASSWRDPRAACVRDIWNASVGVPLPFLFLRRVGGAKRSPRGLDVRRRTAWARRSAPLPTLRSGTIFEMVFAKTRARMRRENENLFPPSPAGGGSCREVARGGEERECNTCR